MNLLIFVLLSFIWTNSGLDTNRSDGSPTKGLNHVESTEIEPESSQRRPVVIVTGVMIMAFVFTCFRFIHYNCLSDDTPKLEMLRKEGATAKSARPPSKVSLRESQTDYPCTREKPSLLSIIGKLSSVSNPEKSPTPSSIERLSRPLSPQKQCMSSRIQKGKNPSRRGKKRLSRSPKKFESFQLEKSYRTCKLEKPYNLGRARKLVRQAASSDLSKAVSLPWPAGLQYTVRPTLPLCAPRPHNRTSPPKRSSVQKLTKSPRQRKLKRSACARRADMLFRLHLIKACRCYKEGGFVLQHSEPFVRDISETSNRNAQSPLFSSKLKPFTQSFLKADYTDKVFCDIVSDSDVMTYDGSDSGREVTVVCKMNPNETIPKGSQDDN